MTNTRRQSDLPTCPSLWFAGYLFMYPAYAGGEVLG